MDFTEWWNKQNDYETVKNSKKYGTSFIKLLCENAWIRCELETLKCENKITKEFKLQNKLKENNKNLDISTLKIKKTDIKD